MFGIAFRVVDADGLARFVVMVGLAVWWFGSALCSLGLVASRFIMGINVLLCVMVVLVTLVCGVV